MASGRRAVERKASGAVGDGWGQGSDLLVAALENEGVDRGFGVPGEENLDVVESLRNWSNKAGADSPRARRRLHGGDLRVG